MSTRQSVGSRLRRLVLERDKHLCTKCGRWKDLQIHHIVPACMGGQDIEANLITLCASCHKYAPDNPVDFFKWARSHMPPHLESSLKVTKELVHLIHSVPALRDQFNGAPADFEKLMEWIDAFYKDLWEVLGSNSVERFSEMAGKYTALEREEQNS